MANEVSSHAHISCIINGFSLGEWAGVDQPVEFPDLEDLVNVTLGAQGVPFGTTVPKLGGTVMFMHIPNSDSADWWIGEYEYWKQAVAEGLPFRSYEAHYHNLSQGQQSHMTDGFLMQAHHQSTPGLDYTGAIYFTRIRSNNAGARKVPRAVAGTPR